MSGYRRYLPPVLWSQDLDDLLKVFEKLLTGIDDDIEGVPSIAEAIDRLPDLYDPARTPEKFLRWLAGWVGLELRAGWNERQRRRIIGEIVRLYGLRGTSTGLAGHLGLAVPSAGRQRITIDGCSKVLFTRPAPDRETRVHTLLSQGPFIRPVDNTLVYAGLVSPQFLTLTPDGDLVVGDAGGIGGVPKPGVWRITRTGAYADLAGAPALPRPLGSATWNLEKPVAGAVNSTSAVWELYVLDRTQTGLKLYRLTSTTLFQEQVVTIPSAFARFVPAAMTYDRGHLLILDSQAGRLVDLDLTPNPPTATQRQLSGVRFPRSLLVTADGCLIIGAAGTDGPGELFRVDPADGNPRPLLAIDANPLLSPYAVAEQDARHLLVLDVGLPHDVDTSHPYLHKAMRPAGLYQVDLSESPPRVTRVTEPGGLVFPRGMVWHEGTAYLCDGGEPPDGRPRRNFRASAHEVAVSLHFSIDTSEEYQRAVHRGIREALDRERPASALPTVLTAIGTAQEHS